MNSAVDTDRLRSCVVRIDRPDGKTAGTGVLVAPGWTLTCAHVVADLETVVLTPAAGGAALNARVVARSEPPPEGWASALWPFPDLALLRFVEDAPGEQEYSFALLEPVQPDHAHSCVAWGYARRETGVDPVGSPASFDYVGTEGDGWLALKSDVVRLGLSGSPLVCPTRRAVVGVIAATRDHTSTQGGWASPVKALTGEIPGVPESLVEHGVGALAANREAVIAHRAAWHRVLPMPGSENVLKRSWGVYHKPSDPDPADLLLADFRVVPYLFREADLKASEEWCLGPEPLAVGLVGGLGGAGKTRFSVELCDLMIEQHKWVAGEPRDLTALAADVAELPLPRLLVIDYAEALPPTYLAELLDRLKCTATAIAPARVLLLTRERSAVSRSALLSAVRTVATADVKMVIGDRTESRAAAHILTPRERRELYAAATINFSEAWKTPIPPKALPPLAGPDYEQPLGVLYEALDAVLNHSRRHSDELAVDHEADPYWGDGLPGRILRHEEAYWAIHQPELGRDLAARCVALGTLAGAANAEEGDALVSVLPELSGDGVAHRRLKIVRWLKELFEGASYINPIRPDHLGESLVVRRLMPEGDTTIVQRVLLAATSRQAGRALTVLTRCCAHPEIPSQSLFLLLSELPAEEMELRYPDGLYRSDVASCLSSLGSQAMAGAEYERGRRLFSRAREIRRELAEQDPRNAKLQSDFALSEDQMAQFELAAGRRVRIHDSRESRLERDMDPAALHHAARPVESSPSLWETTWLGDGVGGAAEAEAEAEQDGRSGDGHGGAGGE